MKKNVLTAGIVLSLVVAFCPVVSEAGTYMVGAKTWIASWDSSFLEWFEKDVAAHLAQNGVTLATDKDDGSGHLTGPYLSYQSEDGKWAFSLAAMVFSSFSQDWEGSAAGMNMTSDIDLDRKDFDFAVNYSLNNYMRIFAGYKLQIIDYVFTLDYDTLMGRRSDKYKLDARVHCPTVGVGFVYPVLEKMVLSLQLGGLLTIPDLEITDNEGETYDIWPRSTLGYNVEFLLNYELMDDLIWQLGYRYQYFRLDARIPHGWTKTESDDITRGFTLSVVWVF